MHLNKSNRNEITKKFVTGSQDSQNSTENSGKYYRPHTEFDCIEYPLHKNARVERTFFKVEKAWGNFPPLPVIHKITVYFP